MTRSVATPRARPPLLLLLLPLLATLAGGCAGPASSSRSTNAVAPTASGTPAASQPATSATATTPRQPSPASARPAYWLRQAAVARVEASDFEALWRACEASARHFGFALDRLDYRGGAITTAPLTSKQFWEVWRNDVATLGDVANSSIATYRRTLRFDIAKTDGGRFVAEPRVVIERFSRTEQPIAASVYLRNAFRTQRNSRAWGTRETDRGVQLPRQYWYATGRDEALERNVAGQTRKQLARQRVAMR